MSKQNVSEPTIIERKPDDEWCPLLDRQCIKTRCMMWRQKRVDMNPPHGMWKYFHDCALATPIR